MRKTVSNTEEKSFRDLICTDLLPYAGIIRVKW